jgi:hypothetical protein
MIKSIQIEKIVKIGEVLPESGNQWCQNLNSTVKEFKACAKQLKIKKNLMKFENRKY